MSNAFLAYDDIGEFLRDIQVLSVKEPVGSYDDPTSELMIGLLGLMSTFERKTFAMRSKMGMRVRVKQGLWHGGGNVPFGYNYNQETGKLEINTNEAWVVKTIFKRFLEKPSLRGVARYLNQTGIKTKKGRLWDAQLVKNVLQKPLYTGILKYDDIIRWVLQYMELPLLYQ